jgi:hypothetical protein
MPRETLAPKHHRFDWLDRAACRTPDGKLDERFFPGHGKNVSAGAKRICNGLAVVKADADGEAVVTWGRRPCPVREQCLAWAMAEEKPGAGEDGRHGIWGGTTPAERHRLFLDQRNAKRRGEAA